MIVEFCCRAATGESQYKDCPKKPGYENIPIVQEKYTVQNFFKNYSLKFARKEDKRWGVTLHRNTNVDKDDLLMHDIDDASGTNKTPRHSHDNDWYVFPLRLTGSYISGTVPLPEHLIARNYQPWVFNWPTREKDVSIFFF